MQTGTVRQDDDPWSVCVYVSAYSILKKHQCYQDKFPLNLHCSYDYYKKKKVLISLISNNEKANNINSCFLFQG